MVKFKQIQESLQGSTFFLTLQSNNLFQQFLKIFEQEISLDGRSWYFVDN